LFATSSSQIEQRPRHTDQTAQCRHAGVKDAAVRWRGARQSERHFELFVRGEPRANAPRIQTQRAVMFQ
jgi:hypothetical protein